MSVNHIFCYNYSTLRIPELILSEQIFTKEFPSDPDLLPEIEEFIIEIADKINLDKDKHNNLAISVSEAASNSMVHGNKLDINKKVLITVKVSDDHMEIIFKDEGKGFVLDKVPDPTKPENILKESGRGIHIMKNFIDELKYNFTPSGTEAILVIRLD